SAIDDWSIGSRIVILGVRQKKGQMQWGVRTQRDGICTPHLITVFTGWLATRGRSMASMLSLEHDEMEYAPLQLIVFTAQFIASSIRGRCVEISAFLTFSPMFTAGSSCGAAQPENAARSEEYRSLDSP